jgi:multiple sugar transport system substrate-binding protein
MTGRPFRLGACGVLATVAVTLAGVLTACSSSHSGSLRFVWWGNDDRAKATQQAVALFEKANPKIKVKVEFSAYPAYVQKLTTEIAGGASPDLIQVDRPTFGEYQHKHVLVDLSKYVGKSLHLDKMPPELVSGGKADGGQYAAPAGQTTQMVAYDADKFAKAGVTVPSEGWTWQEFTTDMEKVGAATGTAGTTDFGWAVDWFDSWLHTRGKQLYTADGQLGFTADDLTAFWTMTGEMRDKKGVSAAQATTKMDGSMQNSALVTGAAASEFNYDSNLTGYVSSYTSGQVKAAPLPSDNPGATQSGMAALPPVYFAVSKQSKHKDDAVKLMDFLINDPAAGKVLGATRGLPANLDVRAQVCGSADPGNKAVCDYETAVKSKVGPSSSWLWPSGSSAIKTDFQKVYDDVIFGKKSPAAAAAQVVSDAQQSLKS